MSVAVVVLVSAFTAAPVGFEEIAPLETTPCALSLLATETFVAGKSFDIFIPTESSATGAAGNIAIGAVMGDAAKPVVGSADAPAGFTSFLEFLPTPCEPLTVESLDDPAATRSVLNEPFVNMLSGDFTKAASTATGLIASDCVLPFVDGSETGPPDPLAAEVFGVELDGCAAPTTVFSGLLCAACGAAGFDDCKDGEAACVSEDG